MTRVTETASYWYDECLKADHRERQMRDALRKIVTASDQFVRDTGLKHRDAITDAVEAARPMLRKPRNDLAPSPEPLRILLDTDAHCPSCGHNRDKSAVSTIDNQDGTNTCQMCGARWQESSNAAPSASSEEKK